MTMERYTVDIGGPVSILDYGGDGPLIVCVHGLEGSAYNWSLIAPRLAETHRVIAPDLSGFGFTAPLDGGTAVERNVELVKDVIDHFGGEAMLIGNSMGGLISILTSEQYPERVNSLVLIDPAAPVFSWTAINFPTAARLSVPLIPWLGGKLIDTVRRHTSVDEGVVEALTFVVAHPESLDSSVWEHATQIAALRRTQPWATKALVDATNSIVPYVVRKGRFGNLIHKVTQPTLLMHGAHDKLVSAEIARWIGRERPDWTVVLFEDVGHVPMLEAPQRVLEVFEAWESATLSDMLTVDR
ncbi:MAG: alpha/beta hydrolase [Acidimicrobiia bacterium]|nr:MAG: alpha/beta hydrolase [Acidimicrobiia bacterium]